MGEIERQHIIIAATWPLGCQLSKQGIFGADYIWEVRSKRGKHAYIYYICQYPEDRRKNGGH